MTHIALHFPMLPACSMQFSLHSDCDKIFSRLVEGAVENIDSTS